MWPCKVYFRIMPVLRTAQLQGQEDNGALLRSLRDETKQRLQAWSPFCIVLYSVCTRTFFTMQRLSSWMQDGITWLLKFRESDPDRFVFRVNSALDAGSVFGLSCPRHP